MRAIVTPLLDKGLPRRTRAAPIDAFLRSHRDKAGRLVYQLYYLDRGGAELMFGQHLISPQAGEVRERVAVYHGYTMDAGSGQLFAQAWEVEPAGRR